MGEERRIQELERKLAEAQRMNRERPSSAIYIDVREGHARVVFPGGALLRIEEGEHYIIWPGSYNWREDES